MAALAPGAQRRAAAAELEQAVEFGAIGQLGLVSRVLQSIWFQPGGHVTEQQDQFTHAGGQRRPHRLRGEGKISQGRRVNIANPTRRDHPVSVAA